MRTIENRDSIDNRYLDQIIAILREALHEKKCLIYLFGSRAAGRTSPASDFDVAVLSSENVDQELSVARELLESSNIPFTVDLVDLSATSERFLRNVQEEGILLWSS